MHWADGGRTCLDDTMLRCTRHHRLHHEGGFGIRKDYLGNWYFVRPDRKAVPPNGYRPQDMPDEEIHTSAEGSSEALTAIDKNPSAEGWRLMARRLAAFRIQGGRPAPAFRVKGRKPATSRVQSRPACGMHAQVHDL